MRKDQKRKKKKVDTGSNRKKKNNPLNFLKLTPLTFEGKGEK